MDWQDLYQRGRRWCWHSWAWRPEIKYVDLFGWRVWIGIIRLDCFRYEGRWTEVCGHGVTIFRLNGPHRFYHLGYIQSKRAEF